MCNSKKKVNKTLLIIILFAALYLSLYEKFMTY